MHTKLPFFPIISPNKRQLLFNLELDHKKDCKKNVFATFMFPVEIAERTTRGLRDKTPGQYISFIRKFYCVYF